MLNMHSLSDSYSRPRSLCSWVAALVALCIVLAAAPSSAWAQDAGLPADAHGSEIQDASLDSAIREDGQGADGFDADGEDEQDPHGDAGSDEEEQGAIEPSADASGQDAFDKATGPDAEAAPEAPGLTGEDPCDEQAAVSDIAGRPVDDMSQEDEEALACLENNPDASFEECIQAPASTDCEDGSETEGLANVQVGALAANASAPKRPSAQAVGRMVAAKPVIARTFVRATPAEVAFSRKRAAAYAAGEYLLRRTDSNTIVIDVKGSSKSAGAAVQLASSANTASQKWKLALNWLGYYTICNAASGRMLDYAGMPAAGRALVQAVPAHSASQYWVLQKSGGGYMLRSAIDTGFAVECSKGGKATATPLVLGRATGAAAQRFSPMSTSPVVKGGASVAAGVYVIAPACAPSTYVGVQGASQASGANVQTAASAANTAQRWVLTLGSDGYYQLANVSSGRMLDVANGDYVATTNVWQATANGTDAQKWAIRDNGDGTFSLISKKNALALDVCNGGTEAGANLWMYWPNGSQAQRFKLKPVDLLADGIYTFYSKLAPASRALDVKGGSAAQNAELQACASNETFSQKFKVVRIGANAYTLQAAVSGKLVTDTGSRIVQQAKNDKAAASQVWTASWARGGVVLANKQTGKIISTGTTPAAAGTPLKRADKVASSAEAFRPANVSLLERGLYQMGTLAGNARLAAAGGSIDAGANLRLEGASSANGQKFLISPVKDGYFQIRPAFASTAATVTNGSGNNHANVELLLYTGAPSQLWKPEITDAGVVFVNRNSGKVLEAASGAKGANVRQATRTGKANQSWVVSKTKANISELESLLAVVDSAPGGTAISSGPGMQNFRLDASAKGSLTSALARAWNDGYSVGFILSDVQTGATVAMCADDEFYGASTMKAAYVTYLFDWLLEYGEESWGSIGDLIERTVVWSDNDAYEQLRATFGSTEFRHWMNEADAGGVAGSWYAFYSPRLLQRMWAKMLAYEESDGAYVGRWRSTFNNSYMSFIHDGLLTSASAVYSKPGWMEQTGSEYDTYCDSAIVVDTSGRKYLMTIMSDVEPYGYKGVMEGIARALYNARPKMSPL